MSNLLQRKNIRLENYDYSQAGYYFVTICTNDRINLFGQIVGSIHESTEMMQMQLNLNGIVVKSVIENLSTRFINIDIDIYIIMPNHIHMNVVITNEKAIHESPLPKRSLLSKVLGYLKMNSSKQIHLTNNGLKVWQRGYYDHVIRNEQELQEIREYIFHNPTKWQLDKYYT